MNRNRSTRRHNSAIKYKRRLKRAEATDPVQAAERPWNFKNHSRVCSCFVCAYNRRRFYGNGLEGLSNQERRNIDSTKQQDDA